MPGTNDFQPVAAAGGANVVTQAEYLALTTLLADGLTSGIVNSAQLNKMIRQATIMAAMVGQLIADSTGQNATDDGTVATLEANLARAIRGDVWWGADTGSANAYATTIRPAPLALAPGMMVAIDNIQATNTGASTLNVNGLGALPIYGPAATVMQGGELAAGYGAILRVNSTTTAFELVATTGGSLPVKAATQSGQAVNLGQFVESHGSAGYEKLPSGRIRQWATFTISSANTNSTITLPMAFPTAIDFVLASSSSVGTFATALVNGASLSTVLVSVSNANGSGFVYVEGH